MNIIYILTNSEKTSQSKNESGERILHYTHSITTPLCLTYTDICVEDLIKAQPIPPSLLLQNGALDCRRLGMSAGLLLSWPSFHPALLLYSRGNQVFSRAAKPSARASYLNIKATSCVCTAAHHDPSGHWHSKCIWTTEMDIQRHRKHMKGKKK